MTNRGHYSHRRATRELPTATYARPFRVGM
jgi:hypothetical protein